MNERIQQLVEQAKEVSHWLDGGYTPVYRTNLEKFAELIVRECAKTIEDVHSKDLGDYLKEVFGVKE